MIDVFRKIIEQEVEVSSRGTDLPIKLTQSRYAESVMRLRKAIAAS